jgi:hypothetical protein
MVVLAVGLLWGAAPAVAKEDPAHITIAVVPGGTSVGELGRVPGMGVGILSAGIGNVPAGQTYLDIGQGARVQQSLYDRPLPRISFGAGGRGGRIGVRPANWQEIVDRARSAPADLVPGLLGSALSGNNTVMSASGRGETEGIILVGRRGAVITPGCRKNCSTLHSTHDTVGIAVMDLSRLRIAAGHFHHDQNDLLIAIGRPPPPENHGLAVGVAGRGFDGTLTSDSTRMRGFVLDTDLAPTILERLGIAVPADMTGEPIRTDGAVDAAYVQQLSDRLAVIGPRRAPVLGVSVIVWLALTVAAAAAFRREGLRVALTILAGTLALVPAVLLVCAAIEPSELAERLIVGIGCPALAALLLWFAPGLRGLAIAAAASVTAYAVDVIAGSHLTELSLIGPNPIAGIRFYGIGNELEATIAALIPIGTGAALAGWAPRAGPRAAALAFSVTGLAGIAVFTPGRFGADVGAAVGISIGTAVAIGICLGARRWRWAWVIAAPIGALAALVAVDLVSGGNAHLTRSVLDAGGLGDLGQTFQRRLELSAHSFARYSGSAIFWIVVALVIAGLIGRRSVRAWFGARDALWAGFAGAIGGTIAGMLANDSGALLLMIGAVLCAAAVGVAWATHEDRPRPGLWNPRPSSEVR